LDSIIEKYFKIKNLNTKAKHTHVNISRLFTIALITISLFIINPIASSGQNGDPPPPPNEHGQNGNQPPGGGAPIGSGMVFLILLGAAFGVKKMYDYKKRGHEV